MGVFTPRRRTSCITRKPSTPGRSISSTTRSYFTRQSRSRPSSPEAAASVCMKAARRARPSTVADCTSGSIMSTLSAMAQFPAFVTLTKFKINLIQQLYDIYAQIASVYQVLCLYLRVCK